MEKNIANVLQSIVFNVLEKWWDFGTDLSGSLEHFWETFAQRWERAVHYFMLTSGFGQPHSEMHVLDYKKGAANHGPDSNRAILVSVS